MSVRSKNNGEFRTMIKRLFVSDLTLGAKFRICEQKSNRVYIKVSPGQYAEMTCDSSSCIFPSGNIADKEIKLVKTNFYCE